MFQKKNTLNEYYIVENLYFSAIGRELESLDARIDPEPD
jgi:hypothetical protein